MITIDDLYSLCAAERSRGRGKTLVCASNEIPRTLRPVSRLDFVNVTRCGDAYWARGDGEIEVAVVK